MRKRWTAHLLAVGLMLVALRGGFAADALYRDLGEKDGLTRITDALAPILLADDRVKAGFEEINMDRWKGMFVDYLCQVSDGPCEYKGHGMKVVHKGLHLHDAEFNAVVEDLESAMDKAGISYWTQNRLLARLAPLRREIVTR